VDQLKKLTLLLVLVVAFALMSGVAFAETPHGPFDDDSAVCAACHRAHTASAEYLLSTPRVTGLCIACHSGAGADTDVVKGIYVVDGTEAPAPAGYDHGTWGAAASPLMGGGFTQILATSNATSNHMTPGTGGALTLFGVQFGQGTSGPGIAKSFLDCVDCHMPHRSQNYRMLRMAPTGYIGSLSVPAVAGRIVSDNTEIGAPADEITQYGVNKGRRYTEDSGMFNLSITNPSVAGAGEGISKWCGLGCHDFYYRSAVRANNGSANPSPAMQIRVTTSVTLNNTPVATLNVNATGAITAGSTYVWVGPNRFLVTAKTTTSITTTAVASGQTDPGFYTGSDILAGSVISIEGAGMEVYYNLDGVAGNDPAFMHAVDVDMVYTPRNGSSSAQGLWAYLDDDLVAGAPNQANKLPVADIGLAALAYDSGDMMTCLTCHRAHGTAATMGDEAAIPARTISGVAFPSGTNSMLLRLNDRGVCQQCHNMPPGY
jgi:predicted CXXCH cytochrome family protein